MDFLTWFILCCFVALNGGYLLLNLVSIVYLHRNTQERLLNDLPQVFSGLEPAISILVLAYNEETTIAPAIRSMLQLSYSELEIVVVNDGSKDGTLRVLKHEFGLLPLPEAYRVRLATQPVRGIYRSTRHPNLRVIDENNGINAARFPLFCGVDADSIPQRDSLQRVAKPFLSDPQMVATGGTIRMANGSDISDRFLTRRPAAQWLGAVPGGGVPARVFVWPARLVEHAGDVDHLRRVRLVQDGGGGSGGRLPHQHDW